MDSQLRVISTVKTKVEVIINALIMICKIAVSYATTTGTTIHYTTHGGCDLSNATFINRIKSQKSAKNENNIALVEGPKNE